MVIDSVIHTGPVTALFHGEEYILAGIGSCLHIYVNKAGHAWKKTIVREILPGRNIHGFRQDPRAPHRYLVFGQKSIRLVELDKHTISIKLLHDLVEFPDWIWDTTWLQGKEDQICLVLGHNVAVTFDLTSHKLIEAVNCTEKCILYCAKFICNESLVLAVGTVFNEVVLWSPSSLARNKEGNSEPFHRLTGHQGVIFSIDYRPESQYLCSASDDRSIRLYKVDFPCQTPPTLSDWLEMRSSLVHVLYGHQARVWDVRLLTKQLISVGEDSTCCVWSYDGHVIQKFKGHKGKSIWSVAVSRNEDQVITGGGDHSIRLWRLQSDVGPAECKSSTIDLKLEKDDFPRNTMFLDVNRSLVITNKGNLLMYSCNSGEITCLMSDPEYSSYTVMTVSKHNKIIVIGNIKGVVRVIYVGDANLQTFDKKIYEGKVHNVVFVTDDVLITSGPDGKINIWEVRVEERLKLTLLHIMDLPPSKHRWVTSACLTDDNQHLVCGDRTGSVFLYRLAGPDKMSELIQRFPKIHGKSGVTQVCFHDNHLYSVGRDGLYRLYIWDEENTELKLQNSNRVYKGFDWLEQIVFTEQGDTLVYGFHTNMFVVWNMNQNQKVLEIDCGGGHRTWDYVAMETESRFVYVKAREVKVVDVQVRSNQTVVKPSIHGREICDVKHLYSDRDDTGNPIEVMMTCSEDTTINIMLVQYIDSIPQISIQYSLSGHISSVRSLAVCSSSPPNLDQNKDLSTLVISAGGRAQIRFWRVHVKADCDELNCDNSTCDKSAVIKPSNDDRSFRNDDDILRKDCGLLNIECGVSNNHEFLDSKSDVSNSNSSGCSIKTLTASSFNNDAPQNSDSKKLLVDHHSGEGRESTEHLTNDTDGNVHKKNIGAFHKKPRNCSFKQAAVTRFVKKSEDMSNESPTNVNHNSPIRTSYESLGEIKLGKAGRHTKKPWKYSVDNSDPETRILDLCMFHGQVVCRKFVDTLYFFAAACSDGLVRLFAFEESTRETTLILSSKYHDHCVLKTTYIILPSTPSQTGTSSKHAGDTENQTNVMEDSNSIDKGKTCVNKRLQTESSSLQLNQVILLSAATDGQVAFYDITDVCYKYAVSSRLIRSELKVEKTEYKAETDSNSISDELEPVYNIQLHQSGVNSLHIEHLTDSQYVLLTGGDDNAVTVSYIDIIQDCEHKTMDIVLKMSAIKPHAHAAQVTGVWWLGCNKILSASIDQRLCVWNIEETDKSLQISMLDCKFISVSDVSNIHVYTNRTGQYVAVGGEGLQIFKLDSQDSSLQLMDTVTKQTLVVRR